jgi:hypothetical protein
MAPAAATDGWPDRRRKRCVGALALVVGAFAATPAARADVIIPSTGVVRLDSGGVDAACTDLIVAGTLDLDAGALVNLRDVIVQPGGVLNGGSGSITLSRNFTVLPGGTYNAERSTLRYDRNCGPGAPVTPVPTLGSGPLIALGAALALLAAGFLRGAERRRQSNGRRRK